MTFMVQVCVWVDRIGNWFPVSSMNIMRMSAKGTMLIVIIVMVKMSVGLIWMTENLSTTSCEGKDKQLMWNYSLGESEIVKEQQWFYNNTTLIGYQSESRGFDAPKSYKDRIQLFGKSGISLKNVTALDTGEYTLYPKLHNEESINRQTIFLTVYAETQTSMCRQDATIHFEKVLYCVTDSCGRQQSSTRNFSIHDFVVSGNGLIVNNIYLIVNGTDLILNSSWQTNQVFCCSSERNLKCRNGDQFEFCGSFLTLSSDDSRFKKEESSPASSDGYGEQKLILIIVSTTLVFVVLIVIAAIVCWCSEKYKCHQTQCFLTDNIRMSEKHSLIRVDSAPSAGEMERSIMEISQETLMKVSNDAATEESVRLVVQDDQSQMALKKINSVLEQYMGFEDIDLARSIWEKGKGQDNLNDFPLCLDSTELKDFMFPDNIVLQFWQAIMDARVAVSRGSEEP